MTRFRARAFEPESAVSIAGAAAELSKAETDAQASELWSEHREGMETTRILHRSEYGEAKIVLDEQIREQKDSIGVMRREDLSETNNLKDVIGALGDRLQSTQNELQQAVDIETGLRDIMSAEMR